MTKLPAIATDQSYIFADYFKLNVEPEEVLNYFGYDYQSAAMSLPLTDRVLSGIEGLRSRLEESLPYVSLTSEMARREFLIAPVLIAIEKTGITDRQTKFYGAVSLGNIWQFALLDTQTKTITQDLNLFRIPTDLTDLLQVLVGILE